MTAPTVVGAVVTPVDEQRIAVRGTVLGVGDARLQVHLARVHGTEERPRCLCVPGGVEMYVARHGLFVVKRMPDTGARHHLSCPSFELDAQQSGLGRPLGSAVLEREAGQLELKADFPWTRALGRRGSKQPSADARSVATVSRRLSLRGLTHLLFERAGFNRWSPAMEGKRSQGVFCKYITQAAQDMVVNGLPLVDRLYVPEPFVEATRIEAAQRRRNKLSALQPRNGRCPLAVVLAEFKSVEPGHAGQRVWLRHMPDAPLLVEASTWARIARAFAPMFEAKDADGGRDLRLLMTTLIRERRERTYEIDTASLMIATQQWIPLDGVHELPLIQALVDRGRRFAKPLRYEAQSAEGFANAQLLDAGQRPMPLRLVNGIAERCDGRLNQGVPASAQCGWVWVAGEEMPDLPPSGHRLSPKLSAMGAEVGWSIDD